MKPRIFLSHSKKDKDFIVNLSNYLRLANIECWYDEWEIPPGESIRRKIFEDGLPSCDLFLVYLTQHSISSYWVQKELDSMIAMESEAKDKLLLPFVSKNELRESLSYDMKAINIPELNDENFIEPLCKLISRAWQVFHNKQITSQKEQNVHSTTLLKNQVLELENRILTIELTGNADLDKIKNQLGKFTYTCNDETKTLEEIFRIACVDLADGTVMRGLISNLCRLFNCRKDEWGYRDSGQIERELPDMLSRMIIVGVVHRSPAIGTDYLDDQYSLTQLGIKLASQMI